MTHFLKMALDVVAKIQDGQQLRQYFTVNDLYHASAFLNLALQDAHTDDQEEAIIDLIAQIYQECEFPIESCPTIQTQNHPLAELINEMKELKSRTVH